MPFMRIILPLVIAAAFIFAPLLAQDTSRSFSGTSTELTTGSDMYVEAPVNCALGLKFNPLDEECSPTGGVTGWLVYAAVAGGIVAAIIGVLGLLPFLGGIASFFTMLSGLAGTAAGGYLLFQIWQSETTDIGDIQYGLWVALGFAALTLLVGVSGMSTSDND